MALPTVTRISSGSGNTVTMSANASAWHVVFIGAVLDTYPSSVNYTDPTGFTRYRDAYSTSHTVTGSAYAAYGISHSNNLTFIIQTSAQETYAYHYFTIENASLNDSATTSISNTASQSLGGLNNSATAAQVMACFVGAVYPPSGWTSYCSGITPAPHEYNQTLSSRTWISAWDSSTATSGTCSRAQSSAAPGFLQGFTFEYQAPLKRDGVTSIATVDGVSAIANVDGS